MFIETKPVIFTQPPHCTQWHHPKYMRSIKTISKDISMHDTKATFMIVMLFSPCTSFLGAYESPFLPDASHNEKSHQI